MFVSVLMMVLLASAILAWLSARLNANAPRVVALLGALISFLYLITFCLTSSHNFEQLVVLQRMPWISRFNIEYALGIDYLSLILLTLTLFLAVICILVSWREIQEKQGFYYFNLLATIAGIVGVFTALDMFLFFFFWEVMLIPMTALIAIWGHEYRVFAAIKFFIFTQVSSLLMLAAIIATAYFYVGEHHSLNFFYPDWLNLSIPIEFSFWLMLGFFIAFAVKLPSFPVHTWLPDAHTQAPTAGSVLLAGVLLKTGAYGLIRFVIVLFPDASQIFTPIAATLGVFSILYGAKMAFAQQDMKRLIAYSSISHMGFVMLALFSFNAIAYQGAIVTLIAHGLSSAALFSLAGMVYSRIHSRLLNDMGGFWQSAPRFGGFALVFAAAAFGLPGLANFVGEFLSLVGAFSTLPYLTAIAAIGLIGSAIYGMVFFQSAFQGPLAQQSNSHDKKQKLPPFSELSTRELVINLSLVSLLVLVGLFPKVILHWFEPKTYAATNTENSAKTQREKSLIESVLVIDKQETTIGAED